MAYRVHRHLQTDRVKRHSQSAIAHSAGLDAIRPYVKGAPVLIILRAHLSYIKGAPVYSAGLDAIRPYIKGAPVFITTVKLQVLHTRDAHALTQSYSRKV
jgi:hypothetical protein